LPLLDEPPFHLRDHTQDGENDVTHLTSRGHVGIKHCDKCASFLALVHHVQNVARVSTKSV
jgi:hypothetical protein